MCPGNFRALPERSALWICFESNPVMLDRALPGDQVQLLPYFLLLNSFLLDCGIHLWQFPGWPFVDKH